MKKSKMIWDVIYPFVFMMLAVIVTTLVVSIIAAVVTGIRIPDAEELRPVPLIATSVFYIWVLISRRRQFVVDEMRFWIDERRASAEILISGVLAAVCLSDLLERLIDLLGLYQLFPLYESAAAAAFEDQHPFLLILSTVILAPLAEEMMFRGMAYRRARHYLGVSGGALLSSFLFGLYHMNMIQLIYAFALGLLFALLYEASHTLLVPVVCHAAANAWALAVEYGIDQPGRFGGISMKLFVAAEAVTGTAALISLLVRRGSWLKPEHDAAQRN